ncbi:MAG: dTMP kinase [Candidatus Eisenbacteria bacterium]|nr:dTMP kinase [Candidatus Eisenbacteria bacterium]
MPGIFITFEGIEGCGKTTQARLLHKYLKKRFRTVVLTREPGGAGITAQIRRILLDPRNSKLAPLAELFLYLADRAQHMRELVKPTLAGGGIVICDRHADASVAYQGVGRGIGFDKTRRLNSLATGGVRPNLTFLLDVPPDIGLKRVLGRRRIPDRMENEKIVFYNRVRKGYLRLAKMEKQRITVINGLLPREKIHEMIIDEVEEVLSQKRSPHPALSPRGEDETSPSPYPLPKGRG